MQEKKCIGEEISVLYGSIDSLTPKIEEEKKARDQKISEIITPLKKQKYELDKQLAEVIDRLTAVENELSKDPEDE